MAKEDRDEFKKNGQTSTERPAKKVMKKKKKKKRKKNWMVNSVNATVSDAGPPDSPAQAFAHASPTSGSATDSQCEEDEEENSKHLAGFIFLCNGRTKVECYRYRVFGLPKWKLEDVEKIKPGMKLFLFDFELKLLYGVYEATSTGKIDLEPSAFGGRFAAQVKFGIFKACLPLHEKSFKHAIQSNYRRNKFKPELSKSQVSDLISLFRPLSEPLSSAPVASAFPNETPALVSLGDPFACRRELIRAPATMEPRPVQRVQNLMHRRNAATAYPSHGRPPVEHRIQPALSGPYSIPGSQQSYLGGSMYQVTTTMNHRTPSAPAGSYYLPDSQRSYYPGGLAHGMTATEHRTVPTSGDPYYVQDSQQSNFSLAKGATAVEHQSLHAPTDPYIAYNSQGAPLTNGLAHGTVHQSWNDPSNPYSVPGYQQASVTDGLVHGVAHQSSTDPSNPYYAPDSWHAYYPDGFTRVMQDPYSRYKTAEGMMPQSQHPASGSEQQQQLPQQQYQLAYDATAPYYSYQYSAYSSSAATYGTPVMPPQAPALGNAEVSAPVSYYYSFPEAQMQG